MHGSSHQPIDSILFRPAVIVLIALAGSVCLLAGDTLLRAFSATIPAGLDLSFWSEGIVASGWWMLVVSGSLLLVRVAYQANRDAAAIPILGLLWFGYFILIQFRHPAVIPFFDDYTGFLDDYSAIRLGRSPCSLPEWIWQTYWECRIPLPRLCFLGLSSLLGNQVFLGAKLLTTLLLALIAYILLLQTDQRRNPVTALLILSGLLHFGYFFSSLSGLSGTCYYGSLLGSIWALHLQQRNRSIVLILLAASAGALCFASGFVVFLVLALRAWRTGRKSAAGWIAGWTLFFCLLYFYDYHPQRLNALDGFYPVGFLAFIPIFLGNSLQFLYHWALPLLSGLSLTILLLRKHRERTQGIWFDLLLTITGIASMTAFFRHPAGVDWALNIRYGIFSTVALLAGLFLLDPRKASQARWLLPVLLIGLLRTFFFYPETALTQKKNLEMIREWQHGKTERPSRPFYPDNTETVLQRSAEAGLWTIPPVPPPAE